MNLHFLLLAYTLLIIPSKIQNEQINPHFKSKDISALLNLDNCQSDSHQSRSGNALNPTRIEKQWIINQNAISEVKEYQQTSSIVLYPLFAVYNSTLKFKRITTELLSSPFVLAARNSTVELDSCISQQKSVSPFHLESRSICFTNMTLIQQKNMNPSSLIFSSDDSNSAILSNSIITDLSISSSENFLLSGKCKSEQIHDCAFRNMSVKYDKKSDYQMDHSCLLSSMENCFIYSCVNVFEGGISSGSFSSQEFVCRNTTTCNGKREMNALEKKERMDTTEGQSFLLCEWVDCTAPQGGALYVHENENTILTVENSSFTRCKASSTRGGGIFALKISECIVLHTTFVQCSAAATPDYGGGAITIENINIQPIVDDCSFHSCFSGNDGGAIELSGHDIVLQGSTENNIHSSCCTTRQTENRVSTNYYSAVDKSEWLRNDFGRTRFVSSTDSQPKGIDTYACGLDKSYPCSTISRCLTQLIPDLVPNVEVSSGTIIETNGFDCGINTFTVYGQSNMSTEIHTEFEASGLSLFSVSTGTLTARDFVLVHDSAHPNNRGSSLFEISGAGGMRISRLNISFGSRQSTETAFSTELINVQNGMFHMEHVNWAKTISTTSLFSLSSANEITLTLSECAYDGIERTTSGAAVISFSNDKANVDLNCCIFEGYGSRTSADGGSMMLCVGNGNEVKVKDGSFDGCYCSATYGFGGGILLRLLNENSDFLISSSFGTNTAKWGNDIFVISPNLEVTAKSQNITCVTDSLDSLEKVRGYDNGNNSVAIPLCIYLLPIPEEIHVSNSEASNHSHCGIVQFPCLTMKHSLTRQTETKKVVVNGMIMMGDELAFAGQKHEIRGNNDQSGWTVSNSSETSNSSMITANVETELSKLIFSIPPSLSSHSTFISSSSSSMAISRCSLTLQNPSSELTFLFLSVESGTLYIDSFSASSIDLSANPLISLSGSGTNTELINNQWLNMTNCTFTEIERATGNGGCICIDISNDNGEGERVDVTECVFDGCSVLADESRGGAMFSQLKGNIKLNVISCAFTGCTAPTGEEKSGFGGGMALKLIDDYSSFVISSPIFDSDKPNVARYGNDLFVESPNLTKSITNASLPFMTGHMEDISLDSMRGFDGSDTTNAIPLVNFWRVIGSEIFIGGEGCDVCVCGFSDYPCLSMDHSLTRLPEGNERNVSIKGKGYLQKSVDVSGISVKSDESSMCSLECVSSLEGAEGAAMKICGITNFELMKFVVPSSFASGFNYLMRVGSSEGLLTVKDCSFTKMEESGEKIISFGLIKADEGTVVLELVTMQLLNFSQDVIFVLPTTILNIKNLTMKNIELDGVSGLSTSKGSAGKKRGSNEAEKNIIIEWSLLEEVSQDTTDDIPIIRNDNDDEPLKIVIRNTTMKKCGGSKCGKGGGMFCVLNEEGRFDCSFCTISECFCSSTGRGGWLFLECISTVEHPLNFVLSNITFKDNSALRGRDVYVRCHSIETQIVEEQFLLDFRAPFVKELAMWGCTTDSFVGEEDLLLRVVKYQSETIFVSYADENATDSKQCGELSAPCQSLDIGVQHIIPSSYSQLLISKETIINGRCEAKDVIIRSLQSPSATLVHLNSTITNEGSLITTSEKVRIESVKFSFGKSFSYSGSSIIHEANGQLSLSIVDFSSVVESNSIPSVALNSTLLSIANGILHVDNCSVSLLSFKKSAFLLNGDEINITNFRLEQIKSTSNVFEIGQCKEVAFNWVVADEVKLSEGCIIAIHGSNSGAISIGISSFKNCSRNSEGTSVLSASSTFAHFVLSNCSCSNCYSISDKGSIMEMNNGRNILMDLCRFIGVLAKERESENMNIITDICQWNGSLVHSTNSSLVMNYATMLNASSGGLSTSAGNLTIEKGEFENNNPFIEKYPSVRRNILCTDSASLTISSLKGGDGLKDNSSLWILNDGCNFDGIVSERASSFFIPVLENVSVNENGSNIFIKFKGSLFVPCELSFRLVYKTGDVELVETYQFDENSFVSEDEVIGTIPSENISSIANETVVSVMILYGKQLAATSPQILKNRSESKVNGDERISEGGKERKSYWLLIVIILVVVLLIVLIVSIIVTIRWRKAKNENEDLREIVNDNIKKDPKLIEMMTMEMSPEEQWRRAEREAEKKNEERIKKRVYAKSLGHSESSEHLLSESGSTEYILGRDSDKIPQWMLEKVEEEEIQKRSPSPSISSTSTTDSDSTFVRGEDLCPTTSSMSNLVDAMACSSPHEKLIVDLRDSLFMLLHGLNKTKEMAIGTLKEREQTAAQILFWVANLALHSFDEMENSLQSLANLSPHVVLFSEHMVICIVMHSDLLSDDDSDSSSISSSTVVTSASDDDDSDSLPSSAFEEDEDAFRKECLRWKAPELQMNKKMGATKESVVFSIGMMVWECVTLEIPFGEYEGVVAGQKIVNGERPKVEKMGGSSLRELEEKCVVQGWDERVTLGDVKRELFMKIPMGSMFVTASDALDIGDGSRCEGADSEDTDGSFTRIE